MSGPKRADVEAQLNIARDSQRQCANLLAGIEEATIANLLGEVDALLAQAQGMDALSAASQTLASWRAYLSSESATLVNEATAQAQRALQEAAAAAERARRMAREAEHLRAMANETFGRGEQEYQRAADAVRRSSSSWYMHEEMKWAQQAKALFDEAADQLRTAAQARRKAERAAVQALNQVRQAHSTATRALQQARAARDEAKARQRAEEKAKQIAEQQRRSALLAINQARAALDRLAELPHAKFFPGQADALTSALEAALRAQRAQRFSDAIAHAQPIPDAALRLEQATRQALEALERQRAEAEAEIKALAATIESADAALLAAWSDDPEASERARQMLRSAEELLAAERFADAIQQAQAAQQALHQAIDTAARNHSEDGKRQFIAQAVMRALQELGFSVSYAPGSRTEPLRIAGQTPDPTGKGDIDIALPLRGEVHFEVNTPLGDTTCVATVRALQQRLEAYGVRWETTDWGHAEGATEGTRQTVKIVEREKVKYTQKQRSGS